MKNAIQTTSRNTKTELDQHKLLSGIQALTNPDYHKLNEKAERNDRLLHAVLCAYAKNYQGVDDIGWEELGDILASVLMNELGDDEFLKWCEMLGPEQYESC